MRVLFVNRYFHPDHSATSQIASDLAFHLASRGWEVEALTSGQRYDDPRVRLASARTGAVQITRLWSTRFGRASLAGRAVDYATFYASAFFAILRRAGRGTVVVAMTDPPLISVVAALAVTLRRGILVNWIQDLFPEVAEALGMRWLSFLRRVRDWSLRKARANVVLGERMAAIVDGVTRVRPASRSAGEPVVIHNWADSSLAPVAHASSRFTVGYSGNLGRAHDVATIVEAMRRLPDVQFVFIGGGARMRAVERETNVTLLPYAPRERLSESLSSADVHLVSLLPEAEGLIVPSKLYGILAVGRPVIFVGARDGEVARILDEHRCGIAVASGDDAGLARAIRELRDDEGRREEMGRRGREVYLARFAPQHAFAAWERVLGEVSP